ncbi:unnamed protein product [Urochloa humidicola]
MQRIDCRSLRRWRRRLGLDSDDDFCDTCFRCCSSMCPFTWEKCAETTDLEQWGPFAVLASIYSIVDYFIPISVVSIILWLLLRPNNLRPVVDAAVVAQFSLNNATSSLDYDIAIDLRFQNSHNYLNVRYFDLIAVASYGGTRLGPSVDVLPVFVQRPRATNVVHAIFQGSATPLAPAAVEQFTGEATNGSFSVVVTIASTFMYKVPFQKAIYYYDHECPIRFPSPHGSVTPVATVLNPRTLCTAMAR